MYIYIDNQGKNGNPQTDKQVIYRHYFCNLVGLYNVPRYVVTSPRISCTMEMTPGF